VLERHQLFEPVSEAVGDIKSDTTKLLPTMDALDPLQIRDALASLADHVNNSGQLRMFVSPSEVATAMTRALREALARDQTTPQIYRFGSFSGRSAFTDYTDAIPERKQLREALVSFFVLPDGEGDPRARRWSLRSFVGLATVEDLDRYVESMRQLWDQRPANAELKLVAVQSVNATLAPRTITDREAFLVYDDGRSTMRWGLALQGPDYTALVAQWYDEMWAKIPPENLVYSHAGWHDKALDLVRSPVEALAAARDHKPT
jgi:hypothetical protein